METMHAAGRRRLPPVPRLGSDQTGTTLLAEPNRVVDADAGPGTHEAATERFVLGPPTGEQPAAISGHRVVRRPLTAAAPAADEAPADAPAEAETDAAQRFVARLRGAAADFAEAAGATSAVVREAVPPARHRRARCRVVLRYADGAETDVTLLGPAGAPANAPSRHGFDRMIRRWLGAGQHRESAWLVPDPDAPGGVAVDVTAWLATA